MPFNSKEKLKVYLNKNKSHIKELQRARARRWQEKNKQKASLQREVWSLKNKEKMEENGDGVEIPVERLFIGVRGNEGEHENSLLIAGKPGIVLGVRLRLFHRRPDGPFRRARRTA